MQWIQVIDCFRKSAALQPHYTNPCTWLLTHFPLRADVMKAALWTLCLYWGQKMWMEHSLLLPKLIWFGHKCEDKIWLMFVFKVLWFFAMWKIWCHYWLKRSMRAATGRDHNGLTNDKSFFGSGLKAKTQTKNTFLLFIMVQRSSQEKCCQSVAVLWKNSIFRKS